MSILDTIIVNIFLIDKWLLGKPQMTKKEFMEMLVHEILEYCKQAALKTKNDPNFISSEQLGFRLKSDEKQKMSSSISKIQNNRRRKCIKCRSNCRFKCCKCGSFCLKHALKHVQQM